jgi:hypothetical protein
MPLTAKGKKILKNMKKTYGAKKAESVFYAMINEGKIKGVEGKRKAPKKGKKK